MRTYSQSDVNKIFSHIPSRTIRSWALILPLEKDLIKTTRLGKHRKYTLENLYHLALIDELSSWGFSLDNIRAVFRESLQMEDADILIINKFHNDIEAFSWDLNNFIEFKIITILKEMLYSNNFEKAIVKAYKYEGWDPSRLNIDPAYKEYIQSNNLNSALLKLFGPKLFDTNEEIKKRIEEKSDISSRLTKIIIDLRYLREFVRKCIEKAEL